MAVLGDGCPGLNVRVLWSNSPQALETVLTSRSREVTDLDFIGLPPMGRPLSRSLIRASELR
jgi:hypothetical protein